MMGRVRLHAGGSLFAVLGLLSVFAPAAVAEGWGTIKGQVVWDGGAVPEREKINVNKDQGHCLSKGPLLSEKYVINPKNKGVRWVAVWLLDAKDPKKKLPINPTLPAPAKLVTIDQPCCLFEPHILVMREGEDLVIKNSAPIAHNANVLGGALGPNINPTMPPNTSVDLPGIKARPNPIQVTCGIHGWMKAYIYVFNHPYYALTDDDGKFEIKGAPAGPHRLVVWHETGWVVGDPTPSKLGNPINIKAGAVTDVGEIKLKPSND